MTNGYRRHLIVLAAGFVASIAVFSKAFGPYLTWEGEPLSAQVLTIFLMPITATAIVLLVRSLQRRRIAGENHDADQAVLSIVFWIVCFLIGVHELLLVVLVRPSWIGPWASRAVILLLGLTFIAVGNLLPRTRPNVALGIRTSRTLSDRKLWILTHRVSGYIAVAVGVVTVLSGALESGVRVAQWPVLASIAGGVVLLVTYRRLAQGAIHHKGH